MLCGYGFWRTGRGVKRACPPPRSKERSDSSRPPTKWWQVTPNETMLREGRSWKPWQQCFALALIAGWSLRAEAASRYRAGPNNRFYDNTGRVGRDGVLHCCRCSLKDEALLIRFLQTLSAVATAALDVEWRKQVIKKALG